MPEPWRHSQAYTYGHIDIVPTAWLSCWRNPDPVPTTDGGPARCEVDMEAFWEILCRDGLKDPIMMRVCTLTGEGRLEAGNHRCWLAEQKGLVALPCTVELAEGPIHHPGNGGHIFDLRRELLAFTPRRQPFPVLSAPRHVFKIAQDSQSA
jgi:hypothetical protein